ncbi:MAG: MFS transporter [Mycobacteriales bacterium]|nr:MAG: MFS transporter [Pseudonocardiales bacterium]
MTTQLLSGGPAVDGVPLLGPVSRGPADAVATGISTVGLITVLMGAFLSMADFFIVNVALPTIDADLHASAATVELVVAAYGIAYALLLVLGGRLGDSFGRRRLFIAGMAAFTVTSLLCGIAPTALTLVIMRAAQGAAAAMMVPQVLATIQASTTGQARSRAIGLYGATAGIASAIGQLAGGVLVSADIAGASWRPIFLVNVPIGVVGIVLALRHLPATRAHTPVPVDLRGTVLLGVTLLCLLVPLMEGRSLRWPAWTWAMLVATPVAAAMLIGAERRLERAGGVPLLPPSLIALPSMRNGLIAGAPFFAGFGGFMFVTAVGLQDGAHLGPLASGLTLVPLAVAFFIASLLTTRLLARYGRSVLMAGAVLQAVGLAVLAATVLQRWPDVGPWSLAPGMIVAGFGQGLIMSPLFRVVLGGVPAERAGIGSGVLVTTQQAALALGVATLGTLFLAEAGPGGMGMAHALAMVLGVQILVAVVFVFTSRLLPG